MTMMTAIAIALVSLAAAALLVRRRRRPAQVLPRLPRAAGKTHLAAHVGMLSDLGHGLTVSPGARWRRLGTLLGVR